jgi:hypothetical protein
MAQFKDRTSSGRGTTFSVFNSYGLKESRVAQQLLLTSGSFAKKLVSV